jgi:outer membrane protein assembly factor BamB
MMVAAQTVSAAPSPPAVPVHFIARLASTVLGINPMLANGPAAPPDTPTLWALLGWARHEFVKDLASNGSGRTSQTTTTLVTSNVEATNSLVDKVSATSPATVTQDALSVTTAADQAASQTTNTPVAQPVAQLAQTIGQFVTSLIPHTTAAISNAVNMVFDTPGQVLLHPITATTFVVGSVLKGFFTDIGVLPALPYADTGWVTLHGDPGNRKQQLGVTPADGYTTVAALQGAAILAAPTLLPDGNIAVTSGLAQGSSNLHVLDKNGNIVWQSAPWNGQVGVDSAAVLSSPIVDRQGNIYVSDGDQLWSYSQTGTARWVTPLPAPPAVNPFAPGSREINPFVSAAFTSNGALFGVTAFGQVMVVNRDTGQLEAPVYQIPGPLPDPTSTPIPPTLWANGLLDPTIIDPVWQIAFGGIVRSANTPAVDAKTGRVFVAASDTVAGKGALYAFDITPPTPFAPGKITVAFSTQMGPGSGSSPTLSPDGTVVYASDNAGLLYAMDTRTGQTIWTTPSNAAAAAAAVDKSGNIYVLTNNSIMSAFSPQGTKLWDADASALAQQILPVSANFGAPVSVGGGNPTVVNGAIVEPVLYGYNVPLQGRMVFVPVKAAIVEFDPTTGKAIRNLVYFNDDNDGILNVAPDGRMYMSIGSVTSSSLAPAAPFLNSLLPPGLSVLAPHGGLNIFTPQG